MVRRLPTRAFRTTKNVGQRTAWNHHRRGNRHGLSNLWQYCARDPHVYQSGPKIGDLVDELERIGQKERFIGPPSKEEGWLAGLQRLLSGTALQYDKNGNNKRAREIGHLLLQMGGGGKVLMIEAHRRVKLRLGGEAAKELEHCWSGIGTWWA